MNILLLETIAPGADKLLRLSANVYMSETPRSGPEIAREHDIHAIVTRGKGQVDADLIDLCPSLKVISRCGVGLDNVDLAYASGKGIKVVNAPGANADTVAEHTLALMLSLQRHLFTTITAVKSGNWGVRNQYNGDEIRGKTLGIIGYGNIGKRVGRLAQAFGMKVMYVARTQEPGEVDGQGSTPVGAALTEVLQQADVLSLHLPLSATTRGLLSAEALDVLPQGALVINTARGEIIDEAALTERLKSGRLGGYAADVLSVEPPDPASPLLALPNVLVTPHAASLTAQTYEHICTLTVEHTLALLSDEEVPRKFIANADQLTGYT